jgi:putative transposase
MTKPYSLDLRDRAVARVVAGETVRSVAATLRGGVSSVVKWSQRFRATGSAAPRKMRGHRPQGFHLVTARRELSGTAGSSSVHFRG